MQTADNDNKIDTEAGEITRKPLSPAARRALAEAEERRKAQEAQAQAELPPKSAAAAAPIRLASAIGRSMGGLSIFEMPCSSL